MLLALVVLLGPFLGPLLGPGPLLGLSALAALPVPGISPGLASALAPSERCNPDPKRTEPYSSPRALMLDGQPTGIKLQTWRHRPSHRLITTIFRIFLTEVMGYDNVTIVYADNVGSSFSEIVNSLSHVGNSDEERKNKPMVNLEVWASSNDTLTKWWHEKTFDVIDVGHITSPGRYAWFMPSYKNANGTEPYSETSWKLFTDSSAAQRFLVSIEDYKVFGIDKLLKNNSGNYYCHQHFCRNGSYVPKRCENENCATLFAGYSDMTDFVVHHIDELQLYVKVIWVGPHLIDITSKLALEYRSRGGYQEVIFLSSIPSELFIHSNITHYTIVTFPPCEELPSMKEIGCKYELMRLMKLSWNEIKDHAPPAYESIRKVEFEHADYKNLLEESLRQGPDNDEKIACNWLQANEGRWKEWIPRPDEKVTLSIGAILPPFDGLEISGKGIAVAVKMAKEALENRTILQDYTINLLMQQMQCVGADAAVELYHDYIKDKSLIGILGPSCSDTLEALASMSKNSHTVVMSYKAEAGSFSDRTKYPYFYRTIGENNQFKYVYLQLFHKIGWSQVASLTEDGQRYTEYLSHLQDLMPDYGFQFISNRKFPHNRDNTAMHNYLKELKSKNARIIIGDVDDDATRSLMCAAYHLDMTSKHGYVWFLPYWPTSHWYDTSFLKNRSEPFNCSIPQIIKAINGHFAVTHKYFAADNEIMQENITVEAWRKKYERNCTINRVLQAKPSEYAGFAYDAVWTLGVALDKFLKENPTYITHLRSENTAKKFAEVISSTDFNGVSGHVSFKNGPSRPSVIEVIQWRDNISHIVGTYFQNASAPGGQGRLELNISKIEWLTPDGSTPWDGKETCFLSGVASALDVNCEVAIVISNITLFGIVGVFLAVVVIIKKRQYDQKLQMQMQMQKYLKSHGIDLLAASNISCLDEWEIPRDFVVVNRKLGQGAFGIVYGGEFNIDEKGWVDVAVKTLKIGSTMEEKLDFLSEAEVMKRLDHKNIVKLIGVCTKSEPVLTVMEFMLYGDLKTYLLARRNHVRDRTCIEYDDVSSKRLTSMALDVARALSYLAELKYVHRDVASRNCLVHSSRVVKLGDFGMTRPMFENDYYKFNRKGMLPVRWMSPESLALGVFTTASDVWAFGVLLYEIITFGSFPFHGLSNSQVLEHVKLGNTLTIPADVKPQLESLIKSCWNLETKKRPQASEIVEFLANNPRLLSPCLDAPLPSVQIKDSEQMDSSLAEHFPNCSLPLNFLNRNIGRSQSVNVEPPNILQDTTQTTLLDSSVCPTEPLLGTPRSSTGGMGLSKYVTLQHVASRASPEHPDEYSSQDTEVVSIL